MTQQFHCWVYIWKKKNQNHYNLKRYVHPLYIKRSTAAAKSLQLCPTLYDPINGSPPGSSIPGILQARTLGWVAISFSNAWKWKVKVKSLSCVRPSVTPWTAAFQAPPSMGFTRQEYWSGVPLPSPIVYEGSFFLHINNCYFGLFDNSHSGRYKVIFHDEFDLHFPEE